MMRILTIIAFVTLLASCRSTRKITASISKKDTTSLSIDSNKEDSLRFVKATLAKLDSNRIGFNTFSSKVNIDYKGGDGKKYDVNASIRMQKDKAIWISANAILGIEAMRVFITYDSIFVLDKINKVYTARSLDYLQEVTSLPLDLPTLQNLIIGNAVFADGDVVALKATSGSISLLTIGQWFKNLLTLDNGNKTLLHSKLDDVNIARNRTADLTYEEYENKKGPLFSTKRRIVVTEKNILEIKLDFKQYDFNVEVSFPFPKYATLKNYERH